MLSNKLYSCLLYTLDGELPADAKIIGETGEKVRIKARNADYSIIVNRSLAESKFWNNENPTFYAC